ncbi:MAG: bifunctional DNA-binding transcriptional regulator/O6-methylguanine-DNA methyltransferase Ada [Gemmatimonadaceae bacterium]|nr:bifunctional DNA-binding transcriptional regulator/O6-methylguanine-DNA methyltransferase Ada [Gemmatimonadaceae bacterium]
MKNSADEKRWLAVEIRDRSQDSEFVYAVSSTGVFCKPSCPSRRPKRANVQFYSSAPDAERAGFRACLRCRPKSRDVTRIERAVIEARALLDSAASEITQNGSDLKSLAEQVGVSPFHLQRHFKSIVGMTPKAYLTKKRSTLLRSNLRKGGSVLRATYESGFNSPSRGYAAAERELGMSPSAYRKDGAGVEITFWISRTSIGRVIVAATQKGVCAVMIGSRETDLIEQLRAEFPRALLTKGTSAQAKLVASVVKLVEGGRAKQIDLDVGGTPFQWKVWEALRKIPVGETRTYGEIARSIGKPNASRAVGRACATNRAAVLIPCHRVVRGDGATGEYRWGADLKQRLLRRESVKQ